MARHTLAAAALAALVLTGCAAGPDVAGAAVRIADPVTVTVTTATTRQVAPVECRQALDLAYEVIRNYSDLTKLNVDVMGEMIDDNWTSATLKMQQAKDILDPIEGKKIRLAGLGAMC